MKPGHLRTVETAHPIAKERAKQELSLRKLAEMSGLSAVAISHLETGRTEPRLSTQRAIAKALGVRITKLWPEDEPSQNGHKR
jgi:transcriptional regulator with XRE-family HTH domain